jgi:hypothetical protein
VSDGAPPPPVSHKAWMGAAAPFPPAHPPVRGRAVSPQEVGSRQRSRPVATYLDRLKPLVARQSRSEAAHARERATFRFNVRRLSETCCPQLSPCAAARRHGSRHAERMGIRYYAYAFDGDRTDEALADPRRFISSDPLADAWGMEPHARVGVATFEPRIPERDLLYVDKAWWDLQRLTGPLQSPGSARPASRMFEGEVALAADGVSWTPWVRALDPFEVGLIAQDLDVLTSDVARDHLRRVGVTLGGEDYVVHFLKRARLFVGGLAREGRGMAYLIG